MWKGVCITAKFNYSVSIIVCLLSHMQSDCKNWSTGKLASLSTRCWMCDRKDLRQEAVSGLTCAR